MEVGQGPEFATLEAEQLVRDQGLRSFPIDPRVIAQDAGISVHEKPAEAGVSGMLIRVGDNFAIAYATHVASEGFRRFSIGHELGHYFLRDHVQHVLGADGVHQSRAGFISRDKYEREADLFAVGLLMPRTLFVPAVQHAGDGLGAIERLAAQCVTSLPATAIRFVEFVDAPVAIVVTNQDEIEYCAMSKQFQSRPLSWLKRGDPIPRRTRTARFNGDPGRILGADRDEGAGRLDDWFHDGPNLGIFEEIIGLGRYGKTLTVLTVDDGAPDVEESEEEDGLQRSWTPTFSRSKRR
jgi:Zn-dependent peptidase ImmA (M78 family)